MASKSMSTLKTELKLIADRNNFTGAVTDAIINMLAYAVYEQQYNVLVATNELDPDKASDINDVIDFAISRLYSVYRGTNPIIKIKLKSTIEGSIKKYQLLWSGKGFNLYSLEEVNNIMVGDTIVVSCMASESIQVVDATESMIDKFFIDFNLSNVSEEILLEVSETVNLNPITVCKSVSDMVNKGYALQVTSYNYGVRFYFSSDRYSRNYNSYRLTYLPYYDKDISEDDLKVMKINGYDVESYSIINHIERDGLNDGIGDKAKMNLNALGSIRSNEDILSVFNNLFAKDVASSSMLVTGTTLPQGYSGAYKDSINIFYAPKTNVSNIKVSELNSFLDAMTPFIPCKSVMINGVMMNDSIKSLKVSQANAVRLNITINIYNPVDMGSQVVFDYLNNIQRKVGYNLNVYKILADINSLGKMSYCKVSITQGSNNISELNLLKNQYIIWESAYVNLNN